MITPGELFEVRRQVVVSFHSWIEMEVRNGGVDRSPYFADIHL